MKKKVKMVQNPILIMIGSGMQLLLPFFVSKLRCDFDFCSFPFLLFDTCRESVFFHSRAISNFENTTMKRHAAVEKEQLHRSTENANKDKINLIRQCEEQNTASSHSKLYF